MSWGGKRNPPGGRKAGPARVKLVGFVLPATAEALDKLGREYGGIGHALDAIMASQRTRDRLGID